MAKVKQLGLKSLGYQVSSTANALSNGKARIFGSKHTKSFLRIRPIYNHLSRRIRAYVLICSLACYLTRLMGKKLRREGIRMEAETLIGRWAQLLLSETTAEVGQHSRREWQWSSGEREQELKDQIQEPGILKSTAAYKRSACDSLT